MTEPRQPTQECRDLQCLARAHNVGDPQCDWTWKYLGLDAWGMHTWKAVPYCDAEPGGSDWI